MSNLEELGERQKQQVQVPTWMCCLLTCVPQLPELLWGAFLSCSNVHLHLSPYQASS